MNYLFTILLAFGLSSIYAQIPLLNENDDWEEWYDIVPYSGGYSIMGLMNSVSDENISPTSFYIWKEADSLRKACVSIYSKKGYYQAPFMEFDISKASIGFVNLSWPTRYKEKISSMKNKDVSIIGYTGMSCEGDRQLSVVSFDGDIEMDSLILYAKGNRSMTIVAEGKEFSQQMECKELKGKDAVGYNWECSIPRSIINKEGVDIFIMTEKRINGKWQFVPEKLQIRL